MDWDDVFANLDHIPDGAAYPARWAEAARSFREREVFAGRARLNMPYGEAPRQSFDLFYPAGKPKGLVVFVHGGYWRAFDRTDWSHLAAGPQAAGWACAMPSYTLAPQARITAITAEIAQAITAVAQTLPGPLVLAGHSAGGHLVARMLCEGVLDAETAVRVARVVPISPVADLRDLTRTTMNETLQIDAAEAARESPVLLPQSVPAQVHVWVGGRERPVFIEQAAALAKVWNSRLSIDGERHHFDVIEGLEDAGSPLMAALLGGL